MKIQSLSKRDASKYRPEKPTLLISIQDGDKAELPFKQRTNHITRRLYTDTLFLYFDDIDPNQFAGNRSFPFLFDDYDAFKIINFLKHHYPLSSRRFEKPCYRTICSQIFQKRRKLIPKTTLPKR